MTKQTDGDFEPLDMNELKLLPDSQKQEYMEFEKLFGTAPWARIKKWFDASATEQIQFVLNAPNWEQTVYARGKRDAFLEMLNFERILPFQLRAGIRARLEAEAEAQTAKEEEDNE